MLNCFYWYSGVWLSVLGLYTLGLSSFNTRLDNKLVIFILVTSFISLILGMMFNKKFKNFCLDNEEEPLKKKIILITLLYFIEFVALRTVPFIDIVFLKRTNYGDFMGIPYLHVLLIGFTSFYIQKCFLNYLKLKDKKYIKYITILLLLFLLCYTRSMIMINFIMIIISSIAIYRKNIAIKLKNIIISFFAILFILYLYGGIGNLRDGYSWNDNSYIEKIGLYTKFPRILPKQYMWSYSYLTSPLANLNHNIINNYYVKKNTYKGIVIESLPSTITKRVFSNEVMYNNPILLREYFNAVTGWCNVYLYCGYFGMYILYCIFIILTLIVLRLLESKKDENLRIITLSTLCIVYSFMFFYNTLTYVGIAFLFWICVINLLPKIKYK